MDEDRLRSDLAGRMQKARVEAWGPKQKPCADALKVHASQISRWEAGTTLPRITELVRFAEACNTTVAELLGISGKQAPTQLLLGLEPDAAGVIVDLVEILRKKTLEVTRRRKRRVGARRT